jgi:cytochrome c oxidase cbb3-type subunit 3
LISPQAGIVAESAKCESKPARQSAPNREQVSDYTEKSSATAWSRMLARRTIEFGASERNMHFRRLWVGIFFTSVLCLCLGFPLTLSADDAVKPDPMAKESVQRGKAKFQQSCSLCHGAEATGGAGPSLIESSLVRHDENDNQIGKVIQDGRPDKGMPAFPLMSSADISDIAAFLHARIEVTDSLRSEPVGGYSLQQLLTGNAAAGKQYFYGAGKCETCHSPTGDLAGIATKYSPAELEARFLNPPDVPVAATVSMASGKVAKGTLFHRDAFYIAILNEDGWYRSWPLQDVKVQVKDPLAWHLALLKTYKDKDIHDIFAYLETLK